jgi:CDP-glucose 4,6-dehydratase
MSYPNNKLISSIDGPIMVTGHTGFKGTWLTLLLEQLGVPVVGYSLPANHKTLYQQLERLGKIPEKLSDINDIDSIKMFINEYKPSCIVHMAAQAIVLDSYKNPFQTFNTNVMGTVNLLTAAFDTDYVKSVVVVTTDKVYKNSGMSKFFKENDSLEGKDPYSASKVGTEAAVAAWQKIASLSGGPKIFAVRAGNVIGGGDLANDRLFPDIMRGLISNQPIQIRNPKSTRPWQHVLDPIVGYLQALDAVLKGTEIKAINFGPSDESLTVEEIITMGSSSWPIKPIFNLQAESNNLEAQDLYLDSTYANSILKWKPHWSQPDAAKATIKWWDKVVNKSVSPLNACLDDISEIL